MKVLVVGGGGREHTLIWKLAQSAHVSELYCAPGNGGIASLATCVNIKATDISGMVQFAQRQSIDYVVVAPDDPLALGMVDAMQAAGIPAFGPSKAAARIEASKSFAKRLMKKYGIPTADYREFEDSAAALRYLETAAFPVVVKADGLALGKGVLICNNLCQAQQAVRNMMCKRAFGAAGDKIIIEEFITGPEVSILAFCDGKTVRPMISAQDHKRAFDNDLGGNTGGMGTFAPSPKYTADIEAFAIEHIFQKTVDAMQAEGCPFSGVLYFGLMLTPNGVKVLEYNARFGDPETQVVLPLLKTDLLDILRACTFGRLSEQPIEWAPGAAVCVVLASGGYPERYQTGFEITGLADVQDALVFHAGTKLQDDTLRTNGGRVLCVTAVAQDLPLAIQKAYAQVPCIHFEGMHYRTDIGKK